MENSTSLQVHYSIASEKGLNSVTTLIVGSKAAVATTDVPAVALFATHHHPDHFFAANLILEAYPKSKLYAHPYMRAAVNREYDEASLIGLLGPVFGDTIDHTLFWLPHEKVVITGDAVYGRSDHVWVGDIETLDILSAWNATLRLIEGLNPDLIIPGHIGEGWIPDIKEDIRHMHQYLDRFETKLVPTLITGSKNLSVDEIFRDFKEAFPQCTKHHDFILRNTANQFGSDGQIWGENKHHNITQRTKDTFEGWNLGPKA